MLGAAGGGGAGPSVAPAAPPAAAAQAAPRESAEGACAGMHPGVAPHPVGMPHPGPVPGAGAGGSAAVRPHYGSFTIAVKPSSPAGAEPAPEVAAPAAAPARATPEPAPTPATPAAYPAHATAPAAPASAPAPMAAAGGAVAPGGYGSPYCGSAAPSEDDEGDSDDEVQLSPAELEELQALLAVAQRHLPVRARRPGPRRPSPGRRDLVARAPIRGSSAELRALPAGACGCPPHHPSACRSLPRCAPAGGEASGWQAAPGACKAAWV